MSDIMNDIMNESHFEYIYNYSHIASATLCVICLKKYNPILLFLLLFTQLGYLTVTLNETIQVNKIVLFICGFVLYLISEYIMNTNKIEIKYNTLWKIPYFGIITYYILTFASNMSINDTI